MQTSERSSSNVPAQLMESTRITRRRAAVVLVALLTGFVTGSLLGLAFAADQPAVPALLAVAGTAVGATLGIGATAAPSRTPRR